MIHRILLPALVLVNHLCRSTVKDASNWMGNILGWLAYSESDRSYEKLDALSKRKDLIRKIDGYILRTLAASSDEVNTTAGEFIGIDCLPLERVLADGGISLLNEFSEEEWQAFQTKVTSKLDNRKSEGAGIQATVREIIAACNTADMCSLLFEDQTDLEAYIKNPDISVVLHHNGGGRIEDVVLPIELKQFNNLLPAVYQALGHLLRKLRDFIDMYGAGVKMSGFCIGSDGLNISIAHAAIVDAELEVSFTGEDCNPLWYPATRKYKKMMQRETIGVRVIRTLLSKSPEQLGHTLPPAPKLAAYGRHYALTAVAGRGAFGTAFFAQHSIAGPVIIKRADLVTAQQCAQAVNQQQHECDVLRTFTAQALDCAHLPKLPDANWEVTTAVPFLPLLPVGVPFERQWANTKPEKRGAEARQVLTDITAGLTAAHELHYCHRDVRPQNVVFHPETKSYVVIDWGLAAAPGEPMHPHKGGRCYWPDEMVNAHNERKAGTPYYPRHDLESARYVAWVFMQHRSLQVSWFEMAEYLVTMRQKEVGNWPCA